VKNEARSDCSLISDNTVFAWKRLRKRNEVSEPIFEPKTTTTQSRKHRDIRCLSLLDTQTPSIHVLPSKWDRTSHQGKQIKSLSPFTYINLDKQIDKSKVYETTLKLQRIKSWFHIVHFNDEVVLRCFIYKTLLQAEPRNGRTGYMIWNVITVITKYGKTRKVGTSFFKPYAHFPGTRDRKKADFRAEIRTRVFPRYEAGVPRIAPNYPGIPKKVAGSIPAGVTGVFHSHNSLPIALWPWGRLSL
jgi:hypothetical protein